MNLPDSEANWLSAPFVQIDTQLALLKQSAIASSNVSCSETAQPPAPAQMPAPSRKFAPFAPN